MQHNSRKRRAFCISDCRYYRFLCWIRKKLCFVGKLCLSDIYVIIGYVDCVIMC